MPVQIVYPLTYKNSTHFNSDVNVAFINQSNSIVSGYRVPADVISPYSSNLTDIDEGTTSPNDNDFIKIIGTTDGTSINTTFGLPFTDLASIPTVYGTKLDFEYSDLLVNPSQLTLRLRTDVSGFNALVGVECYNDTDLVGAANLKSVPSGKVTTTFSLPVYVPITQSFRPNVRLIIGSSGTNPNVGLGNVSFAVLATELEGSGNSAFMNNYQNITILGGVETCTPTLEINDADTVEIDGQTEYSFWQRIRVNSSGNSFQDTLFNSYGTTWESGNKLGSHFYLKEGSGKYIFSDDRRYSGEVVPFIGSDIDPMWLFNNKKIAGLKNSNDQYSSSIVIPHFVGTSTRTTYFAGSPSTFTITFLVTPAEIPSVPDWAGEDNAGGNTAFKFTHNSSVWDNSTLPNPVAPTVIIGDAGSTLAAAEDIAASFNEVSPWSTDNITVVSTTGTSMTFSVSSPDNIPDNIEAETNYEHYTTGALFGPYSDDFTWTASIGSESGTITRTIFNWDTTLVNTTYNNLYNNGNCLRLGIYNYSGAYSFSEDLMGTLVPSSGVYLKTFRKLPDGPFGVTLLSNDLSTNYYYLSNFDRVVNSGFVSSSTFGVTDDIQVMHSGSYANYPMFTQELRVRLSNGSYSGVTRQYNFTNFNERFTGNLLTFSGTVASLYNITNSGCFKVLETSPFSRYPTSSLFEYRPNNSVGLRELIITSGTHPTADQINSYLFNNGNYLPENVNPASYSGSSPRICHKGPNTVSPIYSGDISYLLGDGYRINPAFTTYSIPSGNTINLDMVVYYSGDGDCYINPWIEANNLSERYTWSPTYSGTLIEQPSVYNRGLRILASSGIHKVSFSGPHKSHSAFALNDARLFVNITYAGKNTAYSGGELNFYGANIYSNEGLCKVPIGTSGILNISMSGVSTVVSGLNMSVSGAYSSASGIDLFLSGKLNSASGLNLVMFTGTPTASGISLYMPAFLTKSGLPLFIGSYSTTLTSGLPLFTWSSAGSGIMGGIDLHTLSRGTSNNIPLYISNQDSNSPITSSIPLIIGQEYSSNNSIPLYLESVRSSGNAIHMYVAGLGNTIGGYIAKSGIPLFMARASEASASMVPFYISGPSLSSGFLSIFMSGDANLLGMDIDNAFGTSVLGFPFASGLETTLSTKFVPIYIHGF